MPLGQVFAKLRAWVRSWPYLSLAALGLLWVGGLAVPPQDGGQVYLPVVMMGYAPSPIDRVTVWPGAFWMGCDAGSETCNPDELPLHRVSLSAYQVDRVEVSNGRYQACVEAGACSPPHSLASDTRNPYYGSPVYAGYPVINVDWMQADAFCRWAGGRLPSEAEWEKAARGVQDTRPYPWGFSAPHCGRLNYFNGYSYCLGDTSAAGSYLAGASPYGLLDAAGNVWEWVADWYQENYYAASPSNDPPGPLVGQYKVLRGGSYYSSQDYTRVAARLDENPAAWYPNAGFRCAY